MLNSRLFSHPIYSILPQQLTLEIKRRWILMPFLKFLSLVCHDLLHDEGLIRDWLIDWLDRFTPYRQYFSYVTPVWFVNSLNNLTVAEENRWLDVGCLTFGSKILHLSVDVTISSERLQNLILCPALMNFDQ